MQYPLTVHPRLDQHTDSVSPPSLTLDSSSCSITHIYSILRMNPPQDFVDHTIYHTIH